MLVEEITKAKLKKLSDGDLRGLRHRAVGMYKSYMALRLRGVGELSLEEFLSRYLELLTELNKRGLPIYAPSPLDLEVQDRAVLKALWAGLDVPGLGDIVAVENYVSISGSFAKDPVGANDLDVIIRDERRNEGLELKISRLLSKEIVDKDPHFVYSPTGPNSAYLPVFDLVLRARPATKRVGVREGREVAKKLTPAEQADIDKENAAIAENKKKPEASKPHKFKPAQWTTPNGHPRCLQCGDEEPIGGVCNKKPTKADHRAFNAELDAEFSADRSAREAKKAAEPPETSQIAGEEGLVMDWESLGKRVEKATVTFKVGDKGEGVLQLHVMGITEEEAAKVKASSSRLQLARSEPDRLAAALKSEIGDKGAHLDFRLKPAGADYWEGGELFVGNLDGLGKFKQMNAGEFKMRAAWKTSHADEPTAEAIHGPLGWLDAGARSPELFKPGESGATANQYGMMLRLDKFRFEAYLADEHAKKFNFSGGRLLNGNYLFAYVPVDEGRVWMCSRLADDDNIKEETKKGMAFFKFLKIDRKQQIVGGVVYEPDTVDTQDDYTDAVEIGKAMVRFMEKYALNSRRIKIMHKGEAHYFPVLEIFQPEKDTEKGGEPIKAGSWWMSIKVNNAAIWEAVEKGILTGFSMGGQARA